MEKEFNRKELEEIIKKYYEEVKGEEIEIEYQYGDFVTVTKNDKEKEELHRDDFYKIINHYFNNEYEVMNVDVKTKVFGFLPCSDRLNEMFEAIKVTYRVKHYIDDQVNERKDESKIKNLVINIDMINGFVKEGTLAAPSIMRVVPRQQEILEEYKNAEDKRIIFIRDEHTKDAVEFKTFPEHCLKGSKESELIDELKEYYKDAYDFGKNSTNFVFAPGFQEQIDKFTNLETVTLMGCLSEVCVKNGGITLRNYFDQNNKDIDIYVQADAIDTYDAPGHNAEEVTEQALKDMEANGIKVLGRRVK